ncbi:unnamed protein product [Nyctereutes procyonoides]|uniref:(raccoon dog) hypothetical protein n=1 Tax=Nyctereutes procyonoides TaxID=34880 RepID=A0A811ZE57_NYCPR|nr:unnamed protein product [Nyctereutes procyonoides]
MSESTERADSLISPSAINCAPPLPALTPTPTPTHANGCSLSEPRPRRLPTLLAQLCGAYMNPHPASRDGEKNGSHSNTRDSCWGLRGPVKVGLCGPKLGHPSALAPHRSGPWDDRSVPRGRNLTYGEEWTEALTGPEGERSSPQTPAPVDNGWNS